MSPARSVYTDRQRTPILVAVHAATGRLTSVRRFALNQSDEALAYAASIDSKDGRSATVTDTTKGAPSMTTTTTQDPVDRIAERVANIKAGDPSEAPDPDPEREKRSQQRSAAAQRRLERDKEQVTPHFKERGKTEASASEGSTTTMSTATNKKPAAKKAPAKKATKKSTAKKSTPVKKAPASSNGSAVDVRALPFEISWTTKDGEFAGQSLKGDWGNARYRIKGYLDEQGHPAADVKAGLAAALDCVREGKEFTIHGVRITCKKR